MSSASAGTHVLGPDSATLRVLTRREGLAAKAGHDLEIEVGSWAATLTLGEAPALELTADPLSLDIRRGVGGAKPLTDRDRREIRRNIEVKVLGSTPIRFRSTQVEALDEGRLAVTGELRLAGATASATFELRVTADGELAGSATLTQSRWQIKPYSGLMGALRVADDVRLEVRGRLQHG